jgi:hypothetical protein
MPERLLGTCGHCKTWYLLTDDLQYVEIPPGRTNRGEACPPDIPSASPYAARRRNGIARDFIDHPNGPGCGRLTVDLADRKDEDKGRRYKRVAMRMTRENRWCAG